MPIQKYTYEASPQKGGFNAAPCPDGQGRPQPESTGHGENVRGRQALRLTGCQLTDCPCMLRRAAGSGDEARQPH